MNTKYTPTPWRTHGLDIYGDTTDGNGLVAVIAAGYPDDQRAEDAAFIVRACNAHEELVAAAKNALSLMQMTYSHATDVPKGADTIIPALAAALAKAGEVK